eukprot:CAMPEP_0119398154 /NCGR_PEP_ID=MMETSP1334-20130426/140696_1 /TAXON_ID=127549 /ORGANISM="Calcidiscus leptoporus, Strain RCC1130" /LENGTH=110 /DNA_ID=CAMNT_0007422011 /DNA_START=1146 /DNA_END=1479 /DNA_ORIENTATION=+
MPDTDERLSDVQMSSAGGRCTWTQSTLKGTKCQTTAAGQASPWRGVAVKAAGGTQLKGTLQWNSWAGWAGSGLCTQAAVRVRSAVAQVSQEAAQAAGSAPWRTTTPRVVI